MNGKSNTSSAENNGLKNSIFFPSVLVENTGTITLSSVHIYVSGDFLLLVTVRLFNQHHFAGDLLAVLQPQAVEVDATGEP